MSNALDALRAACEAQFPEDHDWPAALARVEAVIEAARGIDPEFMGHEALAPLRAALAALSSEAGGTASGGGLDEGGET